MQPTRSMPAEVLDRFARAAHDAYMAHWSTPADWDANTDQHDGWRSAAVAAVVAYDQWLQGEAEAKAQAVAQAPSFTDQLRQAVEADDAVRAEAAQLVPNGVEGFPIGTRHDRPKIDLGDDPDGDIEGYDGSELVTQVTAPPQVEEETRAAEPQPAEARPGNPADDYAKALAIEAEQAAASGVAEGAPEA